jgi:hypothetical protein
MRFQHWAASALIAVLLVPSLAAESAGGLSWTVPASWKAQPQRPMRVATYTVPKTAGDAEDGEMIVYYFGPGQGGGVELNVDRWVGQFQAPDGGPADKLVRRSDKVINGIKVTTIDITGTYLFRPSPMAPKATPKPGYRMLAAIAQGQDAPVFFKLTAPKKTADAAEPDYQKMLSSLKKP